MLLDLCQAGHMNDSIFNERIIIFCELCSGGKYNITIGHYSDAGRQTDRQTDRQTWDPNEKESLVL